MATFLWSHETQNGQVTVKATRDSASPKSPVTLTILDRTISETETETMTFKTEAAARRWWQGIHKANLKPRGK